MFQSLTFCQKLKAVIISCDGAATNDLVVLNENGSKYDVCSRSDVQGTQINDGAFRLQILSKKRNQVLSNCGIQVVIVVIQGCDDRLARLSE
jgi:hypothetical protein